ncbi:hypothetical protein [Shewanella surugensis]|uniref:DUF4199 domain-containing protein n=1 Tax=Shewanella surugensis TaxID=212020 RepID=A0ABT0LBK7_9GAMM|nr:hypothetical protein [Shewanella surugensis]MCL1124959.1 hypothetical protein [Shewanella surugensis]
MDESQSEIMKQVEEDESNVIKSNPIAMWVMVLLVYILLLVGIGYIAFFDQDFNNPQDTIGGYIGILDEYKNSPSNEKMLSDEDLSNLLIESMKKDSEGAGDLQELASQSFNIILGAILAFLSGSVTIVFQRVSKQKN